MGNLSVAEKIKSLRKSAKLTQAELGKKLKPGYFETNEAANSFVKRIESGKQKIDSCIISELCKIFEKPVDYFVYQKHDDEMLNFVKHIDYNSPGEYGAISAEILNIKNENERLMLDNKKLWEKLDRADVKFDRLEKKFEASEVRIRELQEEISKKDKEIQNLKNQSPRPGYSKRVPVKAKK